MEMVPTENGLLGGRVRLLQPARGYRVAVDAVLLAAAVDARPGQHILDLGAGVGAVGLCLAARVPDCSVVGIELQPELAALATRNATLNAAGDRLRTIVHDLAKPLPPDLGAFDHVVTNPPYLAAAGADPLTCLTVLAEPMEGGQGVRWNVRAKPGDRIAVIIVMSRLDQKQVKLRTL